MIRFANNNNTKSLTNLDHFYYVTTPNVETNQKTNLIFIPTPEQTLNRIQDKEEKKHTP